MLWFKSVRRLETTIWLMTMKKEIRTNTWQKPHWINSSSQDKWLYNWVWDGLLVQFKSKASQQSYPILVMWYFAMRYIGCCVSVGIELHSSIIGSLEHQRFLSSSLLLGREHRYTYFGSQLESIAKLLKQKIITSSSSAWSISYDIGRFLGHTRFLTLLWESVK